MSEVYVIKPRCFANCVLPLFKQLKCDARLIGFFSIEKEVIELQNGASLPREHERRGSFHDSLVQNASRMCGRLCGEISTFSLHFSCTMEIFSLARHFWIGFGLLLLA